MPDRCRRTREVLPPLAIVSSGQQLPDVAVGQARADGVGTSCSFARVAPGNEVDASKPAADRRLADHLQQATVSIAEHDHITGVGEKVGKMAHHRVRSMYEWFIGLAQLLKFDLPGDGKGCPMARGIDLHSLTALPGRQDEWAGYVCSKGSSVQELLSKRRQLPRSTLDLRW